MNYLIFSLSRSFHIVYFNLINIKFISILAQPLDDVVKHVEKGYKMEAPEGCPSEIYEIMKQSWDLDPDKRPTFALILKKLEHLKTLAV